MFGLLLIKTSEGKVACFKTEGERISFGFCSDLGYGSVQSFDDIELFENWNKKKT